MIFSEGELTKIKIIAYKTKDFENGKKVGEIDVLINPESFKESYTISFKDDQPAGTSGKEQKFDHIKPSEFTIKLLLDSTGIFSKLKSSLSSGFADQIAGLIPSEFSSDKSEKDFGISDQVETLKTMLFTLNSETHETHFIKIAWAALEIKCKIKKFDIDYKLFNSHGYPIRAVVSLTCINTVSDILRKAKENRSSPDLTHIRIVKDGDTLPLMTYKIYGNSKYYIEIARVNNILDFRNLTPGQEIFFPPINKSKSA